MVRARATPGCPNCERLQGEVDALREQLDALKAVVADLQERLASAKKDSSTSSKPPSSDIVKPPKPAPPDNASPRRIGGQPGHPKHERIPFPPEQITRFVEHPLDCCPDCHGTLLGNGSFALVVQQVDVLEPPLTVEQHTCPEYWCQHCQKAYKAELPSHIRIGGLAGPRLTTLIAYLKGVCHASYSTVRKFLRDVALITISRGQLVKIINKVSEALEKPYEELLACLPGEAVLNVDETGHKDNGKLFWTWCFRAELYTLFKIDPRRSADVLIETLGREFDGVLGCDCFSAYRRYMRECDIVVQFCLAHFIRDVKFLCTLPDAASKHYGERLREALRGLFGVIHRKEQYSKKEFRTLLERARDTVLRAAQQDVPNSQAAQRLAARMQKYGASYFEFVTTPGIEPTNNVAEQAIRFVVIDRHITQGTRGEKGQRFCERMWSVLATCSQQGRSVMEYLGRAVSAYFEEEEAPSLLTGQS